MKVRLEITTRCNLNCLHCGAAEYRTSHEWTTEEALKAFEDMISHGVSQVDFLGGEPFIRDDILDLFSYLNDNHVSITVSTNGLLLTEDIIDELVGMEYLGLVSFSIDGASKEVYETIRGENNYEKVLANVQTLVSRKKETKSQFNVGGACVVNGVNASETDALVALADRFDLDTVTFITISWFGNAEKNKDRLYVDPQTEFTAYDRGVRKISRINRIRALKGKNLLDFSIDSTPSTWKHYFVQKYPMVCQVGGKFQCLAGTGTFHVDALGVLYPCEAVKIHMESIEKKIGEYEMMSLPEHTFKEARNSESFKRTVAYVQDKKGLYKNAVPCGSCKYSDGCSVCPLHAHSEKMINSCTEDIMKLLN